MFGLIPFWLCFELELSATRTTSVVSVRINNKKVFLLMSLACLLGDRPDGDLIGKVVDASSQDDELLSLDAGSVLPNLIARSILAPLESQYE